jgi:integrase
MAHVRERRTASGVVYDVRYRVKTADGWKERSYTAKRHDEALLAKINIENGLEPTRAMPDQTTLEEYWESWQRRWSIGKRPKTLRAAESARSSLNTLMPSRLADLKRATVEDVVAELARTAPRQAQLALTHLKRCLRDAALRDHTVDQRILTIPSPVHVEKQIRFLTWDEVERIAAYLDPHVHRIVPLAALTGMRRGELYALTDKQIDLAAGTITLRVTKTRRPRKVWLSNEAKKLLREQLLVRTPNKAGLVFTTRRGAPLGSRFESSFRLAVELAGLEGTTFHALRHTCASLLIAAKANPLSDRRAARPPERRLA